MKIQNIKIEHMLGIRYAELDVNAAKFHVIGGANASGKTTVCDAIRFVFLGEPGRVTFKGQYKQLVMEGEKTGAVTVSFALPPGSSEDVGDFTIRRELPINKVSAWRAGETKELSLLPELPAAMPFVIDSYRFVRLPPDKRKAFLRDLMGVRIGRGDIGDRMNERGCEPSKTEEIMPLLRADTGFDDAHRYAKTKMSEARGAWKGVTGGEVYGEKKAATWRPTIEEVDEDQIEALRHKRDGLDKQIETSRHAIGEARMAQSALECPHCHKTLRHIRKENQSGYQLTPFETTEPGKGRSLEEITDETQRLQVTYGLVCDQLAALEAKLRASRNADDVAARALEFHQEVQAWGKIAEATSPDGIPGELLGAVLAPLNDLLRESAKQTGWQQVQINANMTITANGRWFTLLSESEQWRANVQIAHAISTLAGLGLLIIDRLDLLQKSFRPKTLTWLAGLEYNTILVMSTMEYPPAGLHHGVMFHRLSGGRLYSEGTDWVPKRAGGSK